VLNPLCKAFPNGIWSMERDMDGTLYVSTCGTVASCFDDKVRKGKAALGSMAPSTLHAMTGRTLSLR
jgi:hypothetical protein